MSLIDFINADCDPFDVIVSHKSDYHENFGFQWNRFDKLQLDSFNGSTESRDRLLFQSELDPKDFKDKIILELGAGNGRFTEVLLGMGAKVIAVDYSSAIFANHKNHISHVKDGSLICVQADIFDLPIKKSSFDIVICYGVIQHTGDNIGCMRAISEYLGTDSKLLIDIYSNSLKHFNPWIYIIRPFFSLIKDNNLKLKIVERFINIFFPIQLYILSLIQGKKGIFNFIRYFFYRSPNSVYGINLYLQGKISIEHAKEWSICDTFDAWMPHHDHPVSMKKWRMLLKEISQSFDLSIIFTKQCGQGNCALLEKQ